MVRIVYLPQAIQHLRELGRIDRLDGDFDHRLCIELQGSEYLQLGHYIIGLCYSGGLDNGLVDTLNKHPVSSGNVFNFDIIARVVDPQTPNVHNFGVFLIVEGILLSENENLLVRLNGTTEHTTKHIESGRVSIGVLFCGVDHQRTVGVASLQLLSQVTVLRSCVDRIHLMIKRRGNILENISV